MTFVKGRPEFAIFLRTLPEGLILRSLESVETRGFGRSKDVGPGVGSVGVLPRSK